MVLKYKKKAILCVDKSKAVAKDGVIHYWAWNEGKPGDKWLIAESVLNATYGEIKEVK